MKMKKKSDQDSEEEWVKSGICFFVNHALSKLSKADFYIPKQGRCLNQTFGRRRVGKKKGFFKKLWDVEDVCVSICLTSEFPKPKHFQYRSLTQSLNAVELCTFHLGAYRSFSDQVNPQHILKVQIIKL